MSHRPEREEKGPSAPFPLQTGRYGRYIGGIGIALVVALTVLVLLHKPTGVAGIKRGAHAPPFAVPTPSASVEGAADVAVHADEGAKGKVPACEERGRGILNVCELWERGPVVLALFVDEGSCPAVLSEMQALSSSYPSVSFAGVAIRGDRRSLRLLIRRRDLTIPVGFDLEGALASLYRDVSCPQVSFIDPGGEVQSAALLTKPSPRLLRERVKRLLAVSKARGWRPRAR